MYTSALRCPACGHGLLTIDLPEPAPAAVVAAPSHATRSSEPLLLRVTEVARLMSLSRSTVYQLVAKGEIQVVRIGSAVRVPRTELVRLTEAE